MVPTTGIEMIRIQQRELVRRAEGTRQRREVREERTGNPPSAYSHVMLLVDEANLAARGGLVAEARRLFGRAYGYLDRPQRYEQRS